MNDLLGYCKSKPATLKEKELFLLRNLSRGKGIGFFEDSGFYPDFILWVIEGKKQRLVFIEPHGMLNEDHPDINPKVNLHKKLKSQAVEALRKSKVKNLQLDSFVISATHYDDFRKRICDDSGPWTRDKFASAHILFNDQEHHPVYLEQILNG